MPGSADSPWPIPSAVTATRRWISQPSEMPAIGNTATIARTRQRAAQDADRLAAPGRRGDRAFALEQRWADAGQRHRHRQQAEQPPGGRRVQQGSPAEHAVQAERGERDEAHKRPVAGPGRMAGVGLPAQMGENGDLSVGAHAIRSRARSRGRRPTPTTNPRHPDTSKVASCGVWPISGLGIDQHRDPHAGADQSGRQPGHRGGRDIQDLGGAGAGSETGSAGRPVHSPPGPGGRAPPARRSGPARPRAVGARRAAAGRSRSGRRARARARRRP